MHLLTLLPLQVWALLGFFFGFLTVGVLSFL